MAEKGYLALHIPVAMLRHDTAMTTFGQYWRRFYRDGCGYAAELSRTGRSLFAPDRASARSQLRAQPWRMTGLLAALVAALGEPLIVGTWIAAVALLTAGAMAVGYEAAAARRWTGCDLWTAVLYGINRHALQIPALVGHVHHAWDRLRGRRRGLIDWR